ncbi:universal stress protein [Amycolatopsis solani]|uniref:universal stress protein n=1 Tax=Amycolatopsis solani TaxID=3028615 RepID=UPI0025B1189D|nr:universal stress protein [Amycolatopsis sp. MEP2-6]
MSVLTDYRAIVVGTDGSALAGPTVARAAWLAKHEDADLVIVCAFAELSRRTEAKNIATLGGDSRLGQVLGRSAASAAIAEAVAIAQEQAATIAAALLVDGDPAVALVNVAAERDAELIVIGARHERSVAERLLGTVAAEVLKRAGCDVLVVRPAEKPGEPEPAP